MHYKTFECQWYRKFEMDKDYTKREILKNFGGQNVATICKNSCQFWQICNQLSAFERHLQSRIFAMEKSKKIKN